MDISAEKFKSDGNRPVPLLAALQTVSGFIKHLIEFFSLTEENRQKASIYVGGDGRNR